MNFARKEDGKKNKSVDFQEEPETNSISFYQQILNVGETMQLVVVPRRLFDYENRF